MLAAQIRLAADKHVYSISSLGCIQSVLSSKIIHVSFREQGNKMMLYDYHNGPFAQLRVLIAACRDIVVDYDTLAQLLFF